jgi:hypothetical protein
VDRTGSPVENTEPTCPVRPETDTDVPGGSMSDDLVVHCLLAIEDGQTVEASREFSNLDDMLVGLREAIEHRPDFLAITILHLEDHPRLLEGSEHLGKTTLDD